MVMRYHGSTRRRRTLSAIGAGAAAQRSLLRVPQGTSRPGLMRNRSVAYLVRFSLCVIVFLGLSRVISDLGVQCLTKS